MLIEQCIVSLIEHVCEELDWFASPDIEETMVCTFDCCVGNNTLPNIESMIETGQKKGIFEGEGLELLHQFIRELEELIGICYDEQKGFSKTQRWLDFVDLANRVNIFLKDILQQDKVLMMRK